MAAGCKGIWANSTICMVDIKRPDFLKSNELPELLRWNKFTTDNIDAINVFRSGTLQSLTCVHGTESLFTPQGLSFTPRGFVPLYTLLTDGITAALPVAGTPYLNTSRTDGQLGLTVRFAPPFGSVNLKRSGAGIVVGGGGVQVPMQFDARDAADSGAMSCDVTNTAGTPPANSKIACTQSGTVSVSSMVLYQTTAGSALNLALLMKNNNNAVRWGEQGSPNTAAGQFMFMAPAALIDVTAGDYLQLVLQQNSGVAITTAAGSDMPRFQAQYIAPPVGYSATVVGYLIP